MSLQVFARSPALIRARFLHTTSPVRGHGHYHHLPFAFPGDRKAVFGLKLVTFLLTGFSIPFIATKYQLDKAKAA